MYDEEEKTVMADSPERSSRLPLSHQEKALAELHETIALLTRRLTPVLTPATPSDERSMATDKAAPVQSPLADQLEANNGGIRKASSKLRALMERVEC